jgi:hypothetical protein
VKVKIEGKGEGERVMQVGLRQPGEVKDDRVKVTG